jgi:hypothetical protein
MLISILVLALLAARLFPETPTGRWLNHIMVDLPVIWMSRVERKHVIFLVVVLFAIQGLVAVAPLDMALVAAWDASAYIDLVFAVWTVAIATRGMAAGRHLKSGLRAVSARARRRFAARRTRRRSVRTRPPVRPANDDDRPVIAATLTSAQARRSFG